MPFPKAMSSADTRDQLSNPSRKRKSELADAFDSTPAPKKSCDDPKKLTRAEKKAVRDAARDPNAPKTVAERAHERFDKERKERRRAKKKEKKAVKRQEKKAANAARRNAPYISPSEDSDSDTVTAKESRLTSRKKAGGIGGTNKQGKNAEAGQTSGVDDSEAYHTAEDGDKEDGEVVEELTGAGQAGSRRSEEVFEGFSA